MTKGTKNAEIQRQVRNLPVSSDAVTSEAVSIAAGAAGTLKTCQLVFRPVLDATGTDVGGAGDTSLVLTSTTFTTEVAAKDDADLANGEYWVDYNLGKIRGRKADTATSMTADYSTLQVNMSSFGTLGDVTVAELPTAAALSDATANPTTTEVSANMKGFNGSTWDRVRTGIVSVATSFVGWVNTLPGLRYNATPPTLADGNVVGLQGDVNGLLKTRDGYQSGAEDNTNGVIGTQNKPLAVSTYTWAVDASAALEASTITKAAPGVLRMVTGRIDSTHATAVYYWQTYNSTTLPADGAVTLLTAPLKISHTNGTNTNFSIDYTMNGIWASTGIVQALSTTEFTKTISGAFTSTNTLYK